MQRIIKSVFVFSIILGLPALPLAGGFRVVGVYDGDTLKAVRNNTEIKVQLAGIDAPEPSRKQGEIGQPYSQKATEYLEALILNKTVEIEIYSVAQIGQTLGVVYVDGKNVNLKMVTAGLAEVYEEETAEDLDLGPYWEAQKEAKKAFRGIWELRDQYFSPRDWRITYGHD